MKTSPLALFACLIITSLACKNTADKQQQNVQTVAADSDHPQYVDDIENAHNKAAVLDHETICFNIQYTFGSNSSKMKIFTTPNSSNIRVEKPDGTITVVDDGAVYTNADSTKWKSEQFSVYTWQYFFMVPYKLSDDGTNWQKIPQRELNGAMTDVSKLTFDSGTGDAPDDWYMLHTDPNSNLLRYLGYIVTGGGKSQTEAEKSARAVHYSNYEDVDGVPFATEWTFHNYSLTEGLLDQVGGATLKNVLFMDRLDGIYDTTELTKITQ